MRRKVSILLFFAVLLTAMVRPVFGQEKIATFAGGSFWLLQPVFDSTPGVIKSVVGYAGGKEADPIAEEVDLGLTHDVEAVQITYDPTRIDFQKLIDIYWHNIDPTDGEGQFCDRGKQYRTVIFYHDNEQKELAQQSKAALLAAHQGKQVETEIKPFTTFFPAEDDQQQYYKKNLIQFKFYDFTCGKSKKLKAFWG
jgi:methionine-S-sulfoxide reductase